MANANASLNDKLSNNLQQRQTGAPPQVHPKDTMKGLLAQMEGQIKKAVGKAITPERFTRIATSIYNNNPAFWLCDNISFLSALMMSAQVGLEPNTPLGEAYLIPYGNKVTFQIGYKGILTLALRSGEYKSIYAHEVYKNDEFSYEYGLNKDLHHIPADEPEGEPVLYYAVYKLKNGGEDFVVWSKERIIKHAKKYSKSFNKAKTPWQDNFDSMAKKTVLIDVLKYAPKSVEVQNAIDFNEKAKEEIREDMENAPEIDLSSAIEVDYEVVDDTKETAPENKQESKKKTGNNKEEISTEIDPNQISILPNGTGKA